MRPRNPHTGARGFKNRQRFASRRVFDRPPRVTRDFWSTYAATKDLLSHSKHLSGGGSNPSLATIVPKNLGVFAHSSPASATLNPEVTECC